MSASLYRAFEMNASQLQKGQLLVRNICIFYYDLKKLLTHIISIPNKTQEILLLENIIKEVYKG